MKPTVSRVPVLTGQRKLRTLIAARLCLVSTVDALVLCLAVALLCVSSLSSAHAASPDDCVRTFRTLDHPDSISLVRTLIPTSTGASLRMDLSRRASPRDQTELRGARARTWAPQSRSKSARVRLTRESDQRRVAAVLLPKDDQDGPCPPTAAARPPCGRLDVSECLCSAER